MKVFALIPARSGSKGLLDKNILPLDEKPLLAWSIDEAKKSCLINRIFVSTDSLSYQSLSIDCGAEAPFLRPEQISGDRSTDYEFVEHFLTWCESQGEIPDLIVHLRPTSPIREATIVDAAITKIIDNDIATSLRSVHVMSESAYKCVEMSEDNFLLPLGATREGIATTMDEINTARQQFPQTYVPNGYVDVLRVKFIKSSKKIHGGRVLGFITPPVIEVDSEFELQLLNQMVLTRKNRGYL